MKKIFVFDIEETLLTTISPTRQPYINQVQIDPSHYNPYHPLHENVYHNTRSMCYTINREKMAEIMKAILANGDEIAFATTGPLSKDRIHTFFQRKRRYLGRYFAHPMMQNRRAKRDDYKPSAVRVTQRYVP
ncbi:hypothetical protein Psal071_01024 [Piscirickettsia salmonis]|uniref:Uncharacterized protein n=1 Tax=Piscirickettsia salmonis TaxID=1238 RepID=A0A9Q6PTC7_PISSA|nr:hypothetical protein [Piscirickettsia salmonis]ALA24435.1 transposase [Piscirickettsia salmonis]APS44799.1 hypothetical protein AVI48_10775 [Piscirickettsia salmonis]APS48158.1 hypothetical protein AVI49_11380 [Piscirickettsia salmonis]APS49429.1 hypothetical protein AVI50_00065 [Piscirickettsia salmonis]QGN95655.1 hypothetical protein Psal006a_02275 [Piscirickettsia salmonis]